MSLVYKKAVRSHKSCLLSENCGKSSLYLILFNKVRDFGSKEEQHYLFLEPSWITEPFKTEEKLAPAD